LGLEDGYYKITRRDENKDRYKLKGERKRELELLHKSRLFSQVAKLIKESMPSSHHQTCACQYCVEQKCRQVL